MWGFGKVHFFQFLRLAYHLVREAWRHREVTKGEVIEFTVTLEVE
jgi:hypothetical protein